MLSARLSRLSSIRTLRDARREGFTFLEIVTVIVLLGIFFTLAVPNFDGLTPKYRLRTGARRLGGDLEPHRILAITRGVWLGVRYVLDEEASYYELLRPPPAVSRYRLAGLPVGGIPSI